jgi:hypothetical protein
MTSIDETPVTDISPWPNGRGFAGAETWWRNVVSKQEKQRLDYLLGVALLDREICDRLVKERDESLLKAFGLSEATRGWLHLLKVNTLDELAQAIVMAE